MDLYDVFNAVLYVLKTGYQWRMLPNEYPNWKLVHYYFTVWRSTRDSAGYSVLDRALKKMVGAARHRQGRKSATIFFIVDAQSVNNTDTAEQTGYVAGKKVSGIKRHIAVDTQGLPHAIGITTANITDRAGAIDTLTRVKQELTCVENLLVDGGYSGEKFALSIDKLLGATVEVAKRNELHQFSVIPKRWVVERSFAWLEKCRRLWKNCERKLASSLAMVQIAFIALIVRRF